jgi:hypothetical protein
VRAWLRDRGLLLANAGLFVVFLLGMALAGVGAYNSDQQSHGEPKLSLWSYVRTGDFVEAVFENWESEFLQMGVYVILTAFLVQKGSAESKPPRGDPTLDEDPRGHSHDPDAPWPVRRGGWVLRLYEHSLGIVLLALFVLSFGLHLVTGAREYSAEQIAHGEAPVGTIDYLFRSQFWFESLQNWQSEFLAVGTLVILSVYLRQRGSPESKPVHQPHVSTGAD